MTLNLLDISTCVQYFRGRDRGLIRRIQATRADEIRLCSVVITELSYGADHGRPTFLANHLGLLARFLPIFESLPFDDRAAEASGRIRADVAFRGVMIGPYDLQIAAIALVHGLTLVTHNTREFSRIPGLALDDWQSSP